MAEDVVLSALDADVVGVRMGWDHLKQVCY